MTEIITYRLSETGRWGYEFYDGGRNRIGSVNAVIATSSPVLIEGPELCWYSQFGIDNMIVPGTSRQIKDNRTGSPGNMRSGRGRFPSTRRSGTGFICSGSR